ncbi:MAG TPA: NmrA family NAD(P)-binding protein [Vicinamibacteria bacterium]|nr:NmrA family NAD(P)-binding protein [Vicinamibacteria bacterium]
MNILVVGGTGTVGSQVVQELLARREKPRVLTRSREKLATLPTNVAGVVGDTAKPETLPPAFQGIETVVLITSLSPNEAAEGAAVVAAAKKAGAKRIVFHSVYDAEKCPEAPHFASKVEIQKAIGVSGLAWTTVMPNNFFQNDLRFRQAIMEYGVYPQPFGGVGLSRVDVRDIAEAIAAATTEAGHEGRRYPLVGPEVLTGAATAALWSRYLDRDVRYGGDDLAAWALQSKAFMPDWMIEDLRVMYRFFQEKGFRASDEDLRQQARILKHPPRRFEDFVKETAAAWCQ